MPRRFRPRYRRAPKSKHTLKALEKKVNRLSKVAIPELSFLDTDINQDVDDSGPQVDCLTLIPQGDNLTDRTGLAVQPEKLYFRLTMTGDPTLGGDISPDDSAILRCVLVRDTKADADANSIIWTDVFEELSVNSHVNMDTDRGRFHIVADWTRKLVRGQDSMTQHAVGKIDMRKAAKLQFNGTSATQASTGKNKLYLMCYSTAPQALTDDHVKVSGSVRFTFRDA